MNYQPYTAYSLMMLLFMQSFINHDAIASKEAKA